MFGNVGTLISFRVGYNDAEALQKEFGNSHQAQQFVDLDKFETLTRLLEAGVNKEAFRARTLPPLENRIGKRIKLIARARERFATSRMSIQSSLAKWNRRRLD